MIQDVVNQAVHRCRIAATRLIGTIDFKPRQLREAKPHRSTTLDSVRFRCEPLEPRLLLSFSDVTSTVFPGETSLNVRFFDYDNDGWLDAVNHTNHWRLWHNDGGVFSDQGPFSAGAPSGQVYPGDIDNDGWIDLFFGAQGYITVLRNAEGTGTFEKITHVPSTTGIIPGGGSVGDFNSDGYIDFYRGGYISNPSEIIVNVPDATQPGGRGFDLAWQGDSRYVRSVTSADYDEDGDLDVYTSAYYLQANALFQNQRNGQAFPFANIGVTGGNGHSVGSQWGDLDNDGDLDLFVGNFAHPGNPESRVYRNEGPGNGFALTDIGQRGVFFRESWGTPTLGDYDNDGNLDLLFTAFGCPGYSCSDTNVLFQNNPDANGPNFTDVTTAQGLSGLYTGNESWADIDNDGDLDLVSGGKLFRNNLGNSNSWLKVDLGGDAKSIGAIVKVTAGGTTRARQVESGYGEARFNPLIIHFGLGCHSGKVDVEVTWLNGEKQSLQTTPNKTLTVNYDKSAPPSSPLLPVVQTFSYNPDDGVGSNGFVIHDGHVAKEQTLGRNWSGSNSLQVFHRDTNNAKWAIMQLDGFLDDLKGSVENAVLNLHLRYPGPVIPWGRIEGDDDVSFRPQVFDIYPMITRPDIGNGDGQIPPVSVAENLCGTPGCGRRWMSWDAKANDRLAESGAVKTGWGCNASGHNGPVPGEDFLIEPSAVASVTPQYFGVPPVEIGRVGYDIDITPIVQGWQNDDFANNGIIMIGRTGVPGQTDSTMLYFHGADTHTSGFANAIDADIPRHMPVLTVTVTPRSRTSGDMNGDATVDNLDILSFLEALRAGGDEATFAAQAPGDHYWAANTNLDGTVDNLDITPFVAILIANHATGSAGDPVTPRTVSREQIDPAHLARSMGADRGGTSVRHSIRRLQHTLPDLQKRLFETIPDQAPSLLAAVNQRRHELA